MYGTDNCQWGQYGNSNGTNGYFSARRDSTDSFPLTGDQTLCDASFSFEVDDGGVDQEFAYDDQFIFVVNDHALFGSFAAHTNMLPQANGAYAYSWGDIFEQQMGYSANPWIVASNQGSYIDIPDPEDNGDLIVGLSDVVLDNILDENTTEITVRMITFGDNDNGDCYHTGLTLFADLTIGE